MLLSSNDRGLVLRASSDISCFPMSEKSVSNNDQSQQSEKLHENYQLEIKKEHHIYPPVFERECYYDERYKDDVIFTLQRGEDAYSVATQCFIRRLGCEPKQVRTCNTLEVRGKKYHALK